MRRSGPFSLHGIFIFTHLPLYLTCFGRQVQCRLVHRYLTYTSMSQVRQLKQSERSCGSLLPTRSPDQTVPGFATVAAGEYHVLHGRCANRPLAGRAIWAWRQHPLGEPWVNFPPVFLRGFVSVMRSGMTGPAPCLVTNALGMTCMSTAELGWDLDCFHLIIMVQCSPRWDQRCCRRLSGLFARRTRSMTGRPEAIHRHTGRPRI